MPASRTLDDSDRLRMIEPLFTPNTVQNQPDGASHRLAAPHANPAKTGRWRVAADGKMNGIVFKPYQFIRCSENFQEVPVQPAYWPQLCAMTKAG
jgi:hypothetical protein